MSFRVLKTEKDSVKQEAKELLEDALKKDFETVFIVGVKDGKIDQRYSATLNVLEKIGMLESLKLELWSGWK